MSKTIMGIEKTAAFLLSLPQDKFSILFKQFDTTEVRELSNAMANLGLLDADIVEEVFSDFIEDMGRGAGVMGSYESTKDLLERCFGLEKMNDIMGEVRGSSVGMWEKLGDISEDVLAGFLKNEHPQTASVILSRVSPDHVARILSRFSEDRAIEVMMRMLYSTGVKKDLLNEVERSLQMEFLNELRRSSRKSDPYEVLAEVFNTFDRATEKRLMGALESRDGGAAEKIKSLMFTFEDLVRFDSSSIQKLIRDTDKAVLTLALKGATVLIQDLFFSNISERALKLLKEDIMALGSVRLRDVEEAQLKMVTIAKLLIENGVVKLSDEREEEMVG